VLVVAGGLVGAGLGFLASSLIVPSYDASAFLLVTPAGQTPVQTSEVQYAQAISQVVTNPSVLAAGGDTSGLPDQKRVRADASPNAPLIEIIVNADTTGAARRQAQAAADAVVAYTDERVDSLGFRAVILAPATAGEPAGLSLAAYLVAGTAMGAVLASLAGLLRGIPALAELEAGSAPPDSAVGHEAAVPSP
jgi:hypothetical protein